MYSVLCSRGKMFTYTCKENVHHGSLQYRGLGRGCSRVLRQDADPKHTSKASIRLELRFWKRLSKVSTWTRTSRTRGLCGETGPGQEANKFSWNRQILWLEIQPEAFRWLSEAPNSAESWSGDINQTYFQKTNNKFIAAPNFTNVSMTEYFFVPAWKLPWFTCSLQVCVNFWQRLNVHDCFYR